MGGPNQLGGAAEFRACAGRCDLCLRFAASDQRARIGPDAGARFDRYRFARKHGLIEQDFTGGEVHVCRNHTAQRKLQHIARHQQHGAARQRSSRPRRV